MKVTVSNRTFSVNQLYKKFGDLFSVFFRVIVAFKSPFSLMYFYIRMKKPAKDYYTLRNGMKIYLSSNPHDSVTVAVIFGKNEYGKIPEHGTIIDIGANIGVFSLYAINNSAKQVYSFEPNPEAYQVLKRNIETNNLENNVRVFNLAVSDKDNVSMYIPAQSSPYNSSSNEPEPKQVECKTISLDTLIDDQDIDIIDLIKIDCEGCEYKVLYFLSKSTLNKVKHIRLEHHVSRRKEELITHLKDVQFEVIHDKNNILWFKNSSR